MLARRLAPQPLEHREPVLIAGDRLAIDQAGVHLEPVNGLDDEWIARCPVVPVPRQQAYADGIPARHEPVAVVLDLVNPVRAGRRSVGWGWEAGFDKTGGHLAQYIGLGRPVPSPSHFAGSVAACLTLGLALPRSSANLTLPHP